LCWNTYHDDLFAVGFGTYDFLGQGSGMVCCYSLKNTSNPEYSFSTESGVLCVDFHVCHPSLLAVGCYDGNVLVYNLRSHSTLPIFSSSVISGNHSDPVWEIHWEKETSNGQELNFYSISSDGKVTNWTLSRNELRMELVMNLALVHSIKMESDEPTLAGFACGSSFHFHTKQPHLFLVGTEEGYIHKCSKSYSGQYLETYQGHHMAVYSLRWNVFHDRVFLSCSADWTVKASI
jgi:dynein intermediate chain 1